MGGVGFVFWGGGLITEPRRSAVGFVFLDEALITGP